MMYQIISTSEFVEPSALGQHFPNKSLPAVLDSATLTLLGVIEIPDPAPTPDQIAAQVQAAILQAMTALFDTTAQSKHYDNRITCALRAGYAGPFQAEGIAFATWMDACNAKGYAMLAEVQAGTMPMPATVAEALALLDPMVWPA